MNTVYGAPLSPFVRKVIMVLEHKGADYQNEVVLPFKTPEAFAKLSPLRKIPAFTDGQLTISDSSVICDYLEHKYPQPSLYPADPVQRARALWFEEYADTRLQEYLGPGLFFERVVALPLLRRPADEARIQRSIEALPAQLDYLEGEVGDGYLVGERLSIADLSVPSVFLNAFYAGYQIDAGRWPRFEGYLQRLWQHPLYAARIEAEQKPLATLRR
jgi:glutathione S-transferase